jgi:hypothetical protein
MRQKVKKLNLRQVAQVCHNAAPAGESRTAHAVLAAITAADKQPFWE